VLDRIDSKTIKAAAASPPWGRRKVLAALVGILAATATRAEERRRFRIAFANISDDPAERVEGLGFTGADVRRSFELAARTLPVEVIYYDNSGGNAEAALANADDAIARKVDLFIEYNSDLEANAEIGRRLRAAGIAALAVNYPVPGAPLYTDDNVGAGRLAGQTLSEFARQNWADYNVVAVIAGDLGDPSPYLAQRVQGITAGLRKDLPDVPLTQLDTSGNPAKLEVPLGKFLSQHTKSKMLVGALDDPTALAAKAAIERTGRIGDCVIVSQGLDRSIHGGTNDKKEIDPSNRGSIILGSVAYYVDRYGYEVFPLAMKMLRAEEVPAKTTTKHILISGKNVFAEYPPTDMN
jgi:ribose transport system substrate-binding protein